MDQSTASSVLPSRSRTLRRNGVPFFPARIERPTMRCGMHQLPLIIAVHPYASSAYQQALADLGPDAAREVELTFTGWSADARLDRVSQNVAGETALETARFTSLLNTFATQLADGRTSVDAWQTACRVHKRQGRELPAAACPAILGRAKSLEDHANSIARASRGTLTSNEAKKLLLKNSGAPVAAGLDAFLRDAPLGNHIVWATFDSADSHADPFVRLPNSHDGICTALGLGHFTTGDTLILLVWNHVDSGSPPLHRPTVADAEDYPYYRPRPEADAPWGLTDPLPPNPDGLHPQPEVVMPETTSQGLRLPFRIVQA